MKMKLEIDMDNAAFQDGVLERGEEVREITDKMANQIADGMDEGVCVDTNGNSCGKWQITT